MRKRILCLVITIFFSASVFCQQSLGVLTIGDKIPNIKLGHLLENGKLEELTTATFKDKYVILDFWATWCQPCISFMLTAKGLKSEFKKDLLIMPVTTQDYDTVDDFLVKLKSSKNLSISTIVADTILKRLFPHISLPHEVWIDKNGIIKYITDVSEVTKVNVDKFIKNEPLNLKFKEDRAENYISLSDAPVLTNQIVNESNRIYQTSLTKAIKGSRGRTKIESNSITIINHPIVNLYKYALGKARADFCIGYNRVILSVKDSTKITWTSTNHDSTNHLFSYELFVRDPFLAKNKFDIMTQDLNRYFSHYGIQAKIEKRNTKCWVLRKNGSDENFHTKGSSPILNADFYSLRMANQPIEELFYKLYYYQQKSMLPIVNDEAIIGNVDLELKCDLSNMQEVNKELSKYGLQFKEIVKGIDMIVISQD